MREAIFSSPIIHCSAYSQSHTCTVTIPSKHTLYPLQLIQYFIIWDTLKRTLKARIIGNHLIPRKNLPWPLFVTSWPRGSSGRW